MGALNCIRHRPRVAPLARICAPATCCTIDFRDGLEADFRLNEWWQGTVALAPGPLVPAAAYLFAGIVSSVTSCTLVRRST